MKRHLLVVLEIATAAFLPAAAMAQRRPPCVTTGVAGEPIPPAIIQACEDLKNQLVGTWSLVTYERVFQDGRKEPLLGVAPKGSLMLDAAGSFTQILARSDVGPFNDKITLEDTRAFIEGTAASFGYFWLGNGIKDVWLEAEFTSFIRGRTSTWGRIAVLSADHLEYNIPRPYGAVIHFVWKRIR